MTHYVLTAALGCAVLVSSSGCTTSDPRPIDASSPVAVTAVAVAAREVPEEFDAGGVVHARVVAAITSRIMAEVRGVAVKPGDAVRAGQTLVVLDGRDLQANRARATSAEAAARQAATAADADREAALAVLALAQVSHKRISDLTAKHSATQGELDETVAALRSAEARVKAADARLAATRSEIDAASAALAATVAAASYATLSAPFDGVVTGTSVEVGNIVLPGQPLMTVEDTRSFRLETRLDESRAAKVKVGAPGIVRIAVSGGSAGTDAAQDVRIDGTVSEVARTASADSHDFLVKIDLPLPGPLRSGMYGRVTFQGPTHWALGVPSTALIRRGQLEFVYVVERDNRAHLRLVNTGDAIGGIVEIRSGLIEGDRVISAPPPTLIDGSPVTAGAR